MNTGPSSTRTSSAFPTMSSPSSTRPTSSTSTTRLRRRHRGLREGGPGAIVLRTFSKIFGLAGLRVGYGIGPAELVTAIGKVRRAFDITSPAQVAALASLGAPARRTSWNGAGG